MVEVCVVHARDFSGHLEKALLALDQLRHLLFNLSPKLTVLLLFSDLGLVFKKAAFSNISFRRVRVVFI
jgi:hypothetical protein